VGTPRDTAVIEGQLYIQSTSNQSTQASELSRKGSNNTLEANRLYIMVLILVVTLYVCYLHVSDKPINQASYLNCKLQSSK